MKFILYIISIFAFISCLRTEVVIFDEMYIEKPVVTSLISPHNDSIKVWVSKTFPYNNSVTLSSLSVDNAIVQLFGNNTSVTLSFDSTSSLYLIASKQFPLIEGETYQLEVTLKSGVKASAKTTIPSGELIIDSVSVEKTGPIIADGFDDYYKFNFKIDIYLPQQTDNFDQYILSGFDIRYDSINDEFVTSKKRIDQPTYINQSTVFNFNCYYYYFLDAFKPVQDSFPLYSFLVNNSYFDYINYQQSVGQILRPEYDFETYTGVFPEYTNIENGYGYFGSYTKIKPYYIKIE